MSILILGAFGQDAYYFAKNLDNKRKKIYISYVRKRNNFRYKKLSNNVEIVKLDLREYLKIKAFIINKKVSLVINLVASYDKKLSKLIYVNYIYNLNLITALKETKKTIKYIYASSSAIFGNKTKVSSLYYNPTTNYAKTKFLSHQMNDEYRKLYDLQIYNLIFFNHFSIIQKKHFLFSKIYFFCLKIKRNAFLDFKPLEIGNILSLRDWSHADDIAKSSVKIFSKKKPGNYFVNSGKKITVKDLIEIILTNLKIIYYFDNKNFYLKKNNKKIFKISQKYMRVNDFEVESYSNNNEIINNPYKNEHLELFKSIKKIKEI